jgi:hypothetical protein
MRSNPLQTRLHRFNPWPCALGFGFRVVFCTERSLTHTSEYDGCVCTSMLQYNILYANFIHARLSRAIYTCVICTIQA